MTNRYSFGMNWKRFLKRNINEERIAIAKNRLLESLRLPNLKGMTFLDIGCGSGIHSLAAFEAGAQEILSLDYDKDSVEATESLRNRSGNPGNWTVNRGDVLDRSQIEDLGLWDIVYSWGVLHHTGQVWNAFRNASIPLAHDGVLLVALYTSDVDPDAEAALTLKRRYNRATAHGQRAMEMRFIWKNLIYPNLRRLRPWVPLTTIVNYRRHRGMSYYTDVRDWLGGWPTEFTSVAETRTFAENQLGLELVACYGGAANTEYLFCRPNSQGYWRRLRWLNGPDELPPPFSSVGGFAFSALLPPWLKSQPEPLAIGDIRTLHLTENNRTLGPNAADLRQIQGFGSGAFNMVDGQLVFSSSDKTDPNRNARCYRIERHSVY